MKKRIRKTGEIVNVIGYTAPNGIERNDTGDFVDYIDSKGIERINMPMNYYWDFEDVEEVFNREIDWEYRRYEIAKDMMAAFLSNSNVAVHGYSAEEHASDAVLYADALIAELKRRGNDETE